MHDLQDLRTGVRTERRVVLMPPRHEALRRVDTSIGNWHQSYLHTLELNLVVAPDGQPVAGSMLVGHPVQQRTSVTCTETERQQLGVVCLTQPDCVRPRSGQGRTVATRYRTFTGADDLNEVSVGMDGGCHAGERCKVRRE